MDRNKPPFDLSNEMINLIAEITEKIGRLEESRQIENNLHLRRQNRIRTIKSTTAIENNTLSLKQVTDILNGKIVLGRQEEIREVQNAFLAYEKIPEYDPYSVGSFLQAHGHLTSTLISSAGRFRAGDVGVFDGDTVVHIGARPEFVPDLVAGLLQWAKHTDAHPLIVSAVVHYEIETIHPFDDGNGRIGRLWQTTLLAHWRSVFEHIPIETIVYKYQSAYYDAIVSSRKENKADQFILFMLGAIREALEALNTLDSTDILPDKITETLTPMEHTVLSALVRYLLQHDTIDNQRAQVLTGKGAESVKKYLGKFVRLNILLPEGANKGRKYRLNRDV